MDKILRDTDITVLTKEKNRDHPMRTCTETLEGMECLKKRLGQLARRRESKPKTWPAREGREGRNLGGKDTAAEYQCECS